MNRKKAVQYAVNSMEMEGFNFTPAEKKMWSKIASGELPLSAAKGHAEEFDRQMRQKFPDKYGTGEE